MKPCTAADLEAVLKADVPGFAELLGTMYALRFTGPVTLHFLNGSPQMVELGRPAIHRFPEHPANKIQASGAPRASQPANSVDSGAVSPASSSP